MSLTATSDVEGYPSAGPVDAPRLVRQRRVHRGWVGLGLLAIVIAALGSVTLFRALGPAHEYLALARDVPVGAELTSADLTVVRLSHSPGITPVPAHQAEEVIGRVAAVPLLQGTLLTPEHLTTERVPRPGEQLLPVNLPRDQLPGRTLRAGDPVLLVATSGRTLGSSAEVTDPRTFPARVHDVTKGDGRDNVVVSVLVDERDGAVVASLAAAGRIAIVLTAGDGQ